MICIEFLLQYYRLAKGSYNRSTIQYNTFFLTNKCNTFWFLNYNILDY